MLQLITRLIRGIPVNRKKGVFIAALVLLSERHYSFEFETRVGIRWSASAFPDILTRHMLIQGLYQDDVIAGIQRFAPRDGVVYDVGGHHGLMACIAARTIGQIGRVVTFEPN